LLTAKIEELLGDSLRQRGRTDKSAELFQDAEGILLANTGLDLYPTLPFLVGAGNLSLKLGRLDKAKGLLNRGFALAKKHLGPSHPMLAEILRNLAEYQSQAGDKTEAGKSLKQALKIWNEKFGPNHLGEVAVLKALAKVDADLGKTAEAAREKKRARAIEQGWKEGGCLWRWDAQTGTDAE
jgi:tetratricopeptide (TPR) repeat protein